MANTALGTPYVVSTDLVANYPTVSSNLADHIDLVTINPFADSTARSTAIPTPVEGQVSYLEDSNRVEVYNGSSWVSVGGKIAQVVSTAKTDTFTTTSSTFTDVTGLSVSITPIATSSKVLVMFSVTGNGNSGNAGMMIRLVRGSTAIAVGDAAGSRTQATIGNIELVGPNSMSNSMDFLDSPNTTSSTTYKIQIRSNVNGQTVFVNRSTTDTDAATFARTVSTITVMEVLA